MIIFDIQTRQFTNTKRTYQSEINRIQKVEPNEQLIGSEVYRFEDGKPVEKLPIKNAQGHYKKSSDQ